MTDRQIIIDGCNVSGCPHYKTGDCLISPVWCDQFYNCDYKQLKRTESKLACKEQECETLKDEIFHLRNEGKKSCAYCADLISKEQECEELNNTITNLENIRDEFSVKLDQLKETNESLLSIQYKLTDNNKRLRQTLAEIKEIAEDYEKDQDFICFMVNLIQKINEVEE